MESLKTLIIDNYDSYTFNLLQLFKYTTHIVVIRNDQFTWYLFYKVMHIKLIHDFNKG
jgi:para-aminobenzoate synthetase